MILSGIIFLPLVFAIVLAVWPQRDSVRHLALGFSLIEFVLSLGMLQRFDTGTAALQLVEKIPWIERFGISYFLGIDGISVMLVMLTTFLVPIIILASWNSIDQKIKGFHAALFILQTAMLGSFLALGGMLPRFLKSHAIWPAGTVTIASALVLVLTVIALIQSLKSSS